MPNTVRIVVEDPDEVLALYGAGAKVLVQSAATETGTYAAIATASVVSGTEVYPVYDTAGSASAWYKWRYQSSNGSIAGDYTDAFQYPSPAGPYLATLAGVKSRLGVSTTDYQDDAFLLDSLARVSTELQEMTGRRFLRSPLSGTATFLFDVEDDDDDDWPFVLPVPVGIATVSLVEIAGVSQPETGGTYTALPSTAWMLRPIAQDRLAGWPATEIILPETGSYSFSEGENVVRITGALGWAGVPGDIRSIAENVVIRRYLARRSGTADRTGNADWSGPTLRWLAPEDRERLEWYRDVVAL